MRYHSNRRSKTEEKMGSGKKKIEIKRVEKVGQRMVTFSKRRRGLFNKARQLRSLTGADIAILTFSPAGRPYTHGEPSFDALVDRYLNTAAAGEKAEEGCEAAAANHHRLNSWLDALQFDASDSIEDLEILKKGLEEIAAKVAEKIDDQTEMKRQCQDLMTMGKRKTSGMQPTPQLSTLVTIHVIANACKVPTTFVSELTESENPDECVKHSDEDQELEQLISGEICFKTHTSDTERRIILSGSFDPLHEGHLKLLEVATSLVLIVSAPDSYCYVGRCGNLLWPGCNTDRPEYTGIPHLLDRSGLLYGELARFVLRLLGIRTKPKKVQPLLMMVYETDLCH
ncbi:hypothetical protein HYC85_003634 [Camellia sinensis]|uniref:MADS-box domain-containing protein n=1 Tax=Camellia sinensis TaxID=4442 RepID=A0A7J7HUT7_CAMSI|nr:hypothetical protein HYC85_003634 [Camellia sinensis]